ncbi:MAG: hypothetical protein Fur0032_05380 [Terrimicrobiaceae bacterium]
MQIPQGDTLHLEGEEDASPLGLEEGGATPVGPLRYSLDIGLSGSGLFATGHLALRVRMTCVVTLEPFEQDLIVDPFCLQKELDGAELVDLTPEVREDIHLALPAHPRSGGADGLARTTASTGHADQQAPNPWAALDQLKNPKR